jgi:hypothetical protein
MKLFSLGFAAVVLAGCASMPVPSAHPSNFLDVGTVYPKLAGNTFYMATGQVDLYKYGFWGDLQKTGKKIDMAVAIQADSDTGRVQRIATLQPDGVTGQYVGELKGGILLTDFQSYPHWLDAVSAMESAVGKLNPVSANYGAVTQTNGAVVFVATPPVWVWGWGYHYHPYYFHRRPFY